MKLRITKRPVQLAASLVVALIASILMLEVTEQDQIVGFWIGNRMYGAGGWIMSHSPLTSEYTLDVDYGATEYEKLEIRRLAWFYYAAPIPGQNTEDVNRKIK